MARVYPKFMRRSEVDALFLAGCSPKYRVILHLGLYLGLRVSEICKLTTHDVDLERSIVMVRQGKGSKDRAVPIPNKLRTVLAEWLDNRLGYLFPSDGKTGHMMPRAVQRTIKRIARRAGIGDVTDVTPHKLRHAYATRLLETGADIVQIKDLLGHSSIATTQIYLHADPQRLREAVEKI